MNDIPAQAGNQDAVLCEGSGPGLRRGDGPAVFRFFLTESGPFILQEAQ